MGSSIHRDCDWIHEAPAVYENFEKTLTKVQRYQTDKPTYISSLWFSQLQHTTVKAE